MNNDPVLLPAPGGQPRRQRGAALLSSTALLAAAAPLASAVPVAAHSAARHTGATLNGVDDPCSTTAYFRALGGVKLPVFAGD
jgi:hypothetical protein